MDAMDNNQLKDLSVHAVERYLNDKVPLDSTISEIAKANHLTDDGIKRLVEVSNQLTYLKIHSLSKDKTFEFDLASFKGVKNHLLQASNPHEKQAFTQTGFLPWNINSNIEKQAGTSESPLDPEPLTDGALFKIATIVEAQVQRRVEEFEVSAAGLEMAMRKEASSDKDFIIKLASLSGEEIEGRWFSDQELEIPKQLLQKKASLEAELLELRKLQKMAAEKTAGILDSPVGAVGKGVGSMALKTGKFALFSATGQRMLAVHPGVSSANSVSQIIGAG